MKYVVGSLDAFVESLSVNKAVLAYFSHEGCSVCKVLKPKVIRLLEEEFTHMQFCDVDVVRLPEVAGQFGVFASPTVVVFFDGHELFRLSRNFGLDELYGKIKRPYGLVFED